MRIINIYANFDILFLLNNMKIKYKELSFYEISVLLYLSKLLSIYDGNIQVAGNMILRIANQVHLLVGISLMS